LINQSIKLKQFRRKVFTYDANKSGVILYMQYILWNEWNKMINETSTQWSEKWTMISCSVFILHNNLKETQIEEECAVQKRKAILDCYRHVLQSRRVLVVVNTYNKLPRPRSVNTSICSVKGEKQQEMQ
jgi:hypothetical protein